MVKKEIYYKCIMFYLRCRDELNLDLDGLMIFGSYAKKKQRKDSDIDVAVLSEKFGKNPIKESVMLEKLAVDIDSRFQVLAINTSEYLDQPNVSPIIYEIQKHHVWII